jgi:hypothetical protein
VRPALDARVGLVVVGEAGVGEAPAAGLGVGVELGVAHVDLGDGVHVAVVDAVAAVVLLGEPVEHVRPHEPRVPALVPDPRGRAEVLRPQLAADRALDLRPDHQRDVVAAGLDLGHRGDQRHRPRRARGLVPDGGHLPQRRLDGGRHRAELALPGEQLTEGVADVHDADVGRGDVRVLQRALDVLREQLRERDALAGGVAREVGLVAADDPA